MNREKWKQYFQGAAKALDTSTLERLEMGELIHWNSD